MRAEKTTQWSEEESVIQHIWLWPRGSSYGEEHSLLTDNDISQ